MIDIIDIEGASQTLDIYSHRAIPFQDRDRSLARVHDITDRLVVEKLVAAVQSVEKLI